VDGAASTTGLNLGINGGLKAEKRIPTRRFFVDVSVSASSQAQAGTTLLLPDMLVVEVVGTLSTGLDGASGELEVSAAFVRFPPTAAAAT